MRKIFTLLAVIVLGVSGCGDNTDDMSTGGQTYYEQTHYGTGTLSIVNEQVWQRNYSTNRLSQAYEMYNEKQHDIIILSEYDEETDDYNQEVGSGEINNGKLNFTVKVPENLLVWDDLEVFFNIITEGEGWDVTIDQDAINGTFIAIYTNDEDQYALIKEGVSGTNNSISDETVYFLYVDRDCTITGESKEDERVMYMFNPFALKLKAGWNTVWYKQTYTTSGRSSFFMDIKNPDLKWVLIPTVPTM
jgi:hypothetical protein